MRPMIKGVSGVLLAVSFTISVAAWAADSDFSGVEERIRMLAPQAKSIAISETPIEGLLMVQIGGDIVYATADGESHLERVEISNNAGEIPVTGMTARAYARNQTSSADWHTAPRKQFAINMMGTLEVEISDGSRHSIGQGDLVFLEDITGKGHVTRVLTPVTNLFIHVPQDWDMRSWARG